MKITLTILALAAAGFLGQSAFADDNSGALRLAMVADGHGGNHSLYVGTRTTGLNDISVALCGSCGNAIGTAPAQTQTQTVRGSVGFVQRANGHGQTRFL